MNALKLKWMVFVMTMGALMVSQCSPFDASQTLPTTNGGAPWRIAYYEGGPWVDYQGELLAALDGLAALNWLEPLKIPTLPDHEDTAYLWQWLAANASSDYIQFVENAYWSAHWQDAERLSNQADCLERLQSGDIDLVIAMGTWAGLDLANDQHSVPTIVMSTSNAVQAGIIPAPHDSGYAHVHAKNDPEEQIREIQTFHDIFEFERIGVIYDYDSPESRIYAALPDLESVAAERGFEIVTCDAPEVNVDEQELIDGVSRCLNEIAPQIDAFYITSHSGLTAGHFPDVLQPLFDHRVATWAMEGPDLVERGALLSIARVDYRAIGQFEAGVIARVLNGAEPGDLEQVFEEPRRIAINLEAARRIGYEPPAGLVESADAVFETIETSTP